MATTKAPPLKASPCPILICGDNAPNAGDDLLFDELDLAGGPNYAGVHLDKSLGLSTSTGAPLSATFRGNPASIDIQGDTLEVRDEGTGIVHRGSDLIGTVIRFHHDPSGADFELRVACYNDSVVPFRPATSDFVPVYDFQARRLPLDPQSNPDAGWFEVCNQDPLLPDPTWTSMPYHALVYRGDKYTRDKRVEPYDPSTKWSFIACNGSAGSKMHLYRHTHASGLDDVDQRTTLLKAITADYCGTGMPTFTVAGHRLAFEIAGGGVSVPPPVGLPVEARWGPAGALCLDTPRLSSMWSKTTVESECKHTFDACYPSGMTLPPDWASSGAHVVTANPSPP